MRSLNLTLTDTEMFPARLCKITRLDGTVLRIAEAETQITVSGDTFAPLDGCQISGIKHVLGGDLPSVEISFVHADGGTIDTGDLGMGVWDGASVTIYVIDRNNITTLGTPLFTGSIQPVTFDIHGRGSFDIRGLAAKAEGFIQTYQPMCRTDLFSTLCGLTAASFAKACVVATIPDRFTITISGMSSPPVDNWFNQGVLVSSSGKKLEIAKWVNATSTVKLYLPVADLLQVSEGLTLYPGCDKTIATCQSKFSNAINFQGEPHFLGAAAVKG